MSGGISPEEYAAMWKLASEFVDAILDKPEPSGESRGPEPVAPAPEHDTSEG